jgi:dTDP-4-amino-4,6-dideoxygalactose transaminase
VALSFSQDKMVDAVSGGALIIRNNKCHLSGNSVELSDLDWKMKLRDRFYPLFTFVIRKTYFFGLGKALHFILRRLNLLSQPLPESGVIKPQKLTGWHANLALLQFKNLNKTLKHREILSGIYSSVLGNEIHGLIRYPYLTEDRKSLISFLARKGVFISDIWYDAPIAPKRYLKQTKYSGQCKNSEYVSERLLNLPTHLNVDQKDAYRIARLIKTWQTTNQK